MAVNTKARSRETWGENKPAAEPCDPTLTAKCTNGTFIGTRKDSLLIFRGIPFACRPTGDRRWKKPAPAPEDDGV